MTWRRLTFRPRLSLLISTRFTKRQSMTETGNCKNCGKRTALNYKCKACGDKFCTACRTKAGTTGKCPTCGKAASIKSN